MSEYRRINPARWLLGAAELRITGALPAAFLNECARRGIPLDRATPLDECTLRVFARTGDLKALRAAAARCGCTLEETARRGAPELTRRLRRRAFVCAGMVLVLFALFFSSLFIWEISVTENESAVPDAQILAVLERGGVGLGSFWPGLRADMIAARALPELPELAALSVNVHGSRAEVLVRGAVEPPEILDETTPTDVAAARAGLVTRVVALEGEALVRPGDTVLAGDVLLSARRGGSLSPARLVHARGEVTARTYHTLTAFAPLAETLREDALAPRTRCALLLGKTRVNFARGSGILGENCGKIQSRYALALEGVFTLPLALTIERVQRVERRYVEADAAALEAALRERLLAELARRLDGRGEVVETYFSLARSADALTLTLRAECLERIDMERDYAG